MSNNIKNAILLGPQGSGKSTQGVIIADFLQINIASSGDILRKVMEQQTELGKKVKSFVNQGVLVPDEHMLALFTEELSKPEYEAGFLLDGFPRNLTQAQDLDKHYKIDKVFDIEISDQEAIERICGRRICDNGHIWHIKHKPSKQAEVCDTCEQALYRRDDDKEDIIAKRLFIYRQETAKLLKYYQSQNKLVTFEGEHTIGTISKNILKYLKKHA